MLLIGDVHGKMHQYRQTCLDAHEETIQIGDMGLGFNGVKYPMLSKIHRFIRGNHDDPAACKAQSPNYLGDYGYLEDKKIFYIGGAWSIDHMYRIPGVSWWEDEELAAEVLEKLPASFTKYKPDIVITHDCPEGISHHMLHKGAELFSTLTGHALQACFEAHRPALWVFGHYHVSRNFNEHGTEFRCLDELETFRI